MPLVYRREGMGLWSFGDRSSTFILGSHKKMVTLKKFWTSEIMTLKARTPSLLNNLENCFVRKKFKKVPASITCGYFSRKII